MAKRITNVTGIFGETRHYDEHGRYLGYSQPGMLGETNHYDASGHRVGYSTPGLFGGEDLYDDEAHRVGYAVQSPLAGQVLHTRDRRSVSAVHSVLQDMPQNASTAAPGGTDLRTHQWEPAAATPENRPEEEDVSLCARFVRWLKKGLFE